MNALQCEIDQLAQPPTAERMRALKHIIPQAAVTAALRASGQHRRYCPRLPKWFLVWFVIALALFGTDNCRQVYKWLQPCRRRLAAKRDEVHRTRSANLCI